MRKQNSVFKTAFTSEVDKNLKNTDSFGYVELDKYACYVIADGIDDQVDGMSAKLAVDTIISAFTEAPSMRKGALRRYLRSANKALLTADSKMRLKASVTVVVTNYVKMRYGQAGNTRFRLYRDGFLRAQSRDQSLSMDLVKAEKLEPDKLTQHQERHNLYCYLGQDKDFRPFISKKLKLSDSDAAALMTRGVWEHLDDGLLKDAFADASDEPQETVDAVEDLLLSMQPKDLGAYTFATIFFNKTYNDPNRKRKIKRAIMIAIPIILVLVVVAVILAVYFHNRQKKIDSMEQSFYDTIEYIQADNYVRAKEECQKALDLAEGLSDKEIQEDAGNYMKLIESVIAGDDALTGGEYSDAQRNFLNARNRTRYADNLGLDYIDDRLEQTSQYMSVYELISLGDTLAQGQQYDKAGLTHIGVPVPVNAKGVMTDERYNGQFYAKGNDMVVADLEAEGFLVAKENITHSYPHCWRCKHPIIYRATEQWFCSVDAIKDAAVKACDSIQWKPEWGKERMTSMITERNDWCISRQRVWGVPIPIFYCEDCGADIVTPETIAHVAALFREHGSNVWFDREAADLLPQGFVCPKCGKAHFTKETDIMDVWFDSGST